MPFIGNGNGTCDAVELGNYRRVYMWMWLNNKLFGTRYVFVSFWHGTVSDVFAVNKCDAGWVGCIWESTRRGRIVLNDDFTFSGEYNEDSSGKCKSKWHAYYGWKQKTP